MGCCGGNKLNPEEAAQDIEKYKKMEHHNRCTDILFLLLFVAFWLGMIVIGSVAFSEGDPDLLKYGIDQNGNLCGAKRGFNGTSNDFTSQKPVMYYDITQYSSAAVLGINGLCVDECPTKSVLNTGDFFDPEAYICTYYKDSSVYGKLSGVGDYDTNYMKKLQTVTTDTDILAAQVSSYAYGGPCYPVLMSYAPFLNRCTPILTEEDIEMLTSNAQALAQLGLDPDEVEQAVKAFDSSTDVLNQYVNDIATGWLILLLAGVLGACALSALWLVFLRYFAGCMAWCTVLIINALFIGSTILCAQQAGFIGEDENGNPTYNDNVVETDDGGKSGDDPFVWGTYVLGVLAAIVLLITILIIPRLRVAVACMKVASNALGAMPQLILFPSVTFCMTLCLMGWWIPVAGFLYATGEIKQDSLGNYVVRWDETTQHMGLYHLFGFLWTNQFIVGFGYMVTAGAVAQFYWVAGKDMPPGPVKKSAYRAIRYHMGTIAFGAFLIAVIQFVRYILEYVDKKTRKAQKNNKLLKFFMCIIKYCMWYLEQVVKYITRNAYIVSAIDGSSFCTSAIRAVFILVSNAGKVLAVNTVGDFLLFLGKMCVTMGVACLAFLLADMSMYTDADSDYYLYSPFLCILIAVLLGYQIASVFMSVYEMAIDTILLSYCIDCSKHGGKAPHAPKLIADAVGEGKAAAERDKHIDENKKEKK
mmetsp:Transcript_22525/g.76592  ORF Transcript_22525/g.76592 Transcript_22525/m.76592 type:complete len:700 (-) Transcript_22525:204-2303(-)